MIVSRDGIHGSPIDSMTHPRGRFVVKIVTNDDGSTVNETRPRGGSNLLAPVISRAVILGTRFTPSTLPLSLDKTDTNKLPPSL